jgi:hypothetical protein
MSWISQVQVVSDGDKWVGNQISFATKEEAEGYVKDLASRWFAVTNTRAIESDKEVTYMWLNKESRLVNLKEGTSHIPARSIKIE